MELEYADQHPHKRLGTLWLKDPSVKINCRQQRMQLCSRPSEFIPFTSQRDGIGRILSRSPKNELKAHSPTLLISTERRQSILPPLAAFNSANSVQENIKLNTNRARGNSSAVRPSNEQTTPEQQANLSNSINKLFVQDREQIERRMMMKMLSERHVKIVKAPLEEKQVFPIGFYDTNEAAIKHRRSPDYGFQSLKEKPQKEVKASPQIKLNLRKRIQSLTALKPLPPSQRKNPQHEQTMNSELPNVLDINEMEKNPDLQRVARMSRLSLKVFGDFDQNHNLFKQKMKQAKMKAIQIKQRIDGI